MSGTVSLIFALAAAPALAQSEAELKRFFEGKRVTVKLDMPGSHLGIDVYPDRDFKADMSSYSSRLKQHGVSIREGDRVMVTLIRVTKKNVEFQLAGGGFGAFGDTSGLPSVPSTSMSKSDRERRLERELSQAPESEKRRIREDLDSERRSRQRSERYARERAAGIQIERDRMILERRREGGSRFNVRYLESRLKESVPTPPEIMRALAEYVDFQEAGPSKIIPGGAQRTLPAASSPAAQIQRGMARAQVHSMLGKPASSRQSKQGDLTAVVERFELSDSITDVTFVGDVVVKFAISSK